MWISFICYFLFFGWKFFFFFAFTLQHNLLSFFISFFFSFVKKKLLISTNSCPKNKQQRWRETLWKNAKWKWFVFFVLLPLSLSLTPNSFLLEVVTLFYEILLIVLAKSGFTSALSPNKSQIEKERWRWWGQVKILRESFFFVSSSLAVLFFSQCVYISNLRFIIKLCGWENSRFDDFWNVCAREEAKKSTREEKVAHTFCPTPLRGLWIQPKILSRKAHRFDASPRLYEFVKNF